LQAFGENLRRLLGLHDLRGREAARLIGVSPQSLSEWMRGHRRPNLDMLMRVSSFLEISGERLLQTPFPGLLDREIADRTRFQRVEKKIGEHRSRPARPSRRTA
jgi:transcriptional regulator with XRE-family HTH domain